MDKIDSKLLSQQYFSVKSSINSLLIIFAYSIASKISLPSNQNVSNKYFQSSTINHYSFAIKNTTKIIKPNSQNQLFPIIRRSTISPSEILFPSNHIRLEIFFHRSKHNNHTDARNRLSPFLADINVQGISIRGRVYTP